MENKYLEEYKRQVLRKSQLKQLEILKVIDNICRKHSIVYWLDGGSCLGAIRHKGFIPWDDDIDIAMRKEDIAAFEKAAKEELPDYLMLQTPQTEDTKEPIIKIRDLNSFYVESTDNFSADYQKGLYVDIFPMEPYPSVSKKFVKRILKGISKSYSILHHSHYYSVRSFIEFFWFGIEYGLYSAIWSAACKFLPKTTFYGNVPKNNGYGIMHRKDSIFPVSEVEFEGCKFMAPHNPDAYLKDLFHNYMEIPPVEKRKIHSIFIAPELLHNQYK